MIRIEIDDSEVRKALEDLRRRASNMKPVMHAIGDHLRGSILERFTQLREKPRHSYRGGIAPAEPFCISSETFVTLLNQEACHASATHRLPHPGVLPGSRLGASLGHDTQRC
jgi:phage gpG-like protein